MSDPVWKAARIKSTAIEFEDHGFLTIWLHLDYGSSGQGFGVYALGLYDDRDHETEMMPGLYRWVKGILQTLGANNWDGLTGRRVWALSTNGKVLAIRHETKSDTFWGAAEDEDEYGDIREVEALL